MITHISIKDFAIIKDLDLELEDGLNIFTGETGSGKSIIIEAISMALGSRADNTYIRTGCDKAVITLVIDDTVIKREISTNGKNLCRIDGEIISLSELNTFCKSLVDIHGQYDHQSLLNPDNHTKVLDSFGGEEIAKVKNIVSESYKNFALISTELRTIKTRIRDAERQKDIYSYEIDEIEKANLAPNEDEELEEEIRLMQNSESIFETLCSISDALFNNDQSANNNLGIAMQNIEKIKNYSEELNSYAYYSIDELNSDMRDFRDKINFSPELLEEKIERSELINKLKRKYGNTIEEILAYKDHAKESMSLIIDAGEKISELESKLLLLKEEYGTAANRLNTLRNDAAKKLAKSITKELNDLNFNNSNFTINLNKCTASENGTTAAEFMISTNKGEEAKPLIKIVSGGELSRIMLALKRIIGDLDSIPTMIFDEIDTGISGATAGVVGEKLKSISSNHQVLCITHLPQIACLADKHYKINKTSDDNATFTNITPLDKDQSIEELARLLSGTEITEEARKQAAKLIQG
ncbi:MAG: DNA repair protein RecN [Bacillota bacterium]|nr:DNA repair protein RecN [Bacillota bacterium]